MADTSPRGSAAIAYAWRVVEPAARPEAAGRSARSILRFAGLVVLATVAILVADPGLELAFGAGSWVRTSCGTDANLRAVDFVSSDVGFVAGDYTIRVTTDGGSTWRDIAPDGTIRYTACEFIDASHGWVVGGNRIARTVDGGETWVWLDAPYPAYPPSSMCFLSEQVGYANSFRGLYKTLDGGASWERVLSEYYGISDVDFVSESTGWATTRDVVWWTGNGGEDWTPQAPVWLSPAEHLSYLSVSAVDAQTAFVAGPENGMYNGGVFRTSDEGVTWSRVRSPGQDWTIARTVVSFADSQNGWMGGESNLLATQDGGQTLQRFEIGDLAGQGVRDITHADSEHAWAVGDNGLVLRYVPTNGLVQEPFDAARASKPDASDKPVIVFVGGLNSECADVVDGDAYGDPVFGYLKKYFTGRGYDTVIAPSKPGAKSATVIDSRHNFADGISADRLDTFLASRDDVRGRKIILVGHSMGGLISRVYAQWWVGSKSRCEPVGMIQLGTPNKGSPMGLLTWLYGGWDVVPDFDLNSDATYSLGSGGPLIKFLNSQFRNTQGVPIYQVAGTYFPWEALKNPRLHIAPKTYKAMLVAIESAHALKLNDGLVSKSSVFDAPANGIEERNQLSVPLAHNLLFGKTWGVRTVVPTWQPTADELKIRKLIERTITECSGESGAFGQAKGGGIRGLSQPGQLSVSALSATSPIISSEAERTSFAYLGGMGGEAAGSRVGFSVEGTSAILLSGQGQAPYSLRFESGDGSVIDGVRLDGAADSGSTMVYVDLEPGEYYAEIVPEGIEAPGAVTLSVLDNGPTGLRVAVPPAVEPGSPVAVEVAVEEGDAARTGAAVLVQLESGTSVSALDSGVAPDREAGDGVYAAVLTAPLEGGPQTVRVRACGANSAGRQFERHGRALFDVIEPRATLTGGIVVRPRLGASGRVGTLTVDVGVSASEPCSLVVAADIQADSTGAVVSQPRVSVRMLAGEETTVTLEVPAGDLFGRLGEDGLYNLDSVTIYDMSDGVPSLVDSIAPGLSGTLLDSNIEFSGLQVGVETPSSDATTILSGLVASVTDEISGVEISLDRGGEWYPVPVPEGGWVGASTAWDCAFVLPEGDYVATARAVSAGGPIPGTTESITFTVDRSAPVVEADVSDYYPAVETTVTIEAADTGSYVADIAYRLDGAEAVTVETEILEVPIPTGAHTIEYWATDAAGNVSEHVTRSFVVGERHVITASAGRGGSISPATEQSVDWGGSQTFVITPDPGFGVQDVLVDGESVGAVSRYTFSDVISDRSITASFAPIALTLEPIAGTSRYATAVEVSKKAFPDGAVCVVIATGSDWPDALGGGAFAAAKSGPILLTRPGELPPEVLAEVRRLKATEAVVLGGEGAVSRSVFDALKAELGSQSVSRIGGIDRYETAEKLARATVDELGASYDGTCLIATGGDFPDALAASPLAAAKGWPLLLSGRSGLSARTLSALEDIGATETLVLGGTGAVPESVVGQLTGRSPERLQGVSRYATARAVAEYGVDHAGLSWDKVALATGEDFPDAVVGGVLQGLDGSVMLLTPGAYLHAEPRAALAAGKGEVRTVRFLGGEGVISPTARAHARAVLE